jgi:hypothetical protein
MGWEKQSVETFVEVDLLKICIIVKVSFDKILVYFIHFMSS